MFDTSPVVFETPAMAQRYGEQAGAGYILVLMQVAARHAERKRRTLPQHLTVADAHAAATRIVDGLLLDPDSYWSRGAHLDVAREAALWIVLRTWGHELP